MSLLEHLKIKAAERYQSFIALLPKFEASLRSATFPNYTPHDIRHSRKIEEIVNRLLPDSFKESMNEEEILLLLYSIYLHDTGMAEDARPPREKEESQDEYLDRARRFHSDLTEKFILTYYREYGLSLAQAGIIGRICKAHSDIKPKDEQRILTFVDLLKENPVENIGIKTVRIHLLAALLRLSDELDIDITRAESRIETILSYPEESRIEWLKHLMVRGIEIRHIDWSIELDVAVEMLTQSKLELSCNEKLSKADNNRFVTDVSVKLRAALAEVAPVLNRYGLGYRTIEFRDKIVQELRRELIRFCVPNFGTTALKPSYSLSNTDLDYQEYLTSVERIPLSPELRIAPYLDERIQLSSNFLDFIHTQSVPPKILNPSMDVISEILFREIEDYDLKFTQDKITSSFTAYNKTIKTLAAFLVKPGIQNLRFNIDKWNNQIKKRLQGKCDSKQINYIADEISKRIGKDLYLATRRRTLWVKLQDHYYIEVIPISFFDSFLGEAERSTPKYKRFMGQCFKATLNNLKKFLSFPSFKLYCYMDSIGVDYSIIAAELLIYPGTRTRLTSADTASLGPFYQDAWALVNDHQTYRVQGISHKTWMFSLEENKKIGRLTAEKKLNSLINRLLNFFDEINTKEDEKTI